VDNIKKYHLIKKKYNLIFNDGIMQVQFKFIFFLLTF